MLSDDGRVVSNFIVQALGGEDLTVFGSGSQTRSFCYVDDMVEGMIRMMRTEEGFTGPVNLGSESETSMLELAEMVVRITGSTSKITFAPLPEDDPVRRRPDITLARERLGWEPRTDLETGLGLTIGYFRGLVQA
ncbi:MAG: hypothetical protein Kow0056_10590 [Coriobacteriia bacterium]